MIVKDLAVQGLPYVMFDERKNLPDFPCIYLVVDSSDRILYIGRSINPQQRWESHHKYEALKGIKGVRIAYMELDQSLLQSVEKALISWFKPPLNQADKHTPRGIEALRREKGMTQGEVAKALGVDVSTVRNWERGREGKKMIVRVAKLCDLFQCSPWDLVEEDQGIEC